ncbi:hypothetical protein COT86_03875 [Candidatus Collierbacteria bacterium CG10_big_fil_rev_8_21_14_0_10_43_36]|uniref:Dephospho-CoA kinase n=1 Tax=Candidatus Collierbacteria bacterium CG10_big_fil_rev_8_21_14_0_10_43_36 TaxID=1974534 RepID=A0A2H0VK57_9BACT|nr:MAG: hypothetical protein COT86_03875 [Candidatus Collierbacteria bacterium CG10_big_fil_rev_8_21_14_0_10_43_36]
MPLSRIKFVFIMEFLKFVKFFLVFGDHFFKYFPKFCSHKRDSTIPNPVFYLVHLEFLSFCSYTYLMTRTAVGLVGPIASGKGEVVKYLKKLGFTVFSLSDRVREEVCVRGLPLSRENLQNIGNELRETYGGHILAERTLEMLGDFEGNIVIDSIRNPSEIEFLKEALGITIIGIDASPEHRLEWYIDRAWKRGEDGTMEKDFVKANSRDLGLGENNFGQQVGRCLAMADVIIQNEDTKKHLLEAVDYYLISELGFSPEGTRRSKEK